MLTRRAWKGSINASLAIWDAPDPATAGRPHDTLTLDNPESDRGINYKCGPYNLDVGAEALLARCQEALTLSYHCAAWKHLMGWAIQVEFAWLTSARARAESSIKALTKRPTSLAFMLL